MALPSACRCRGGRRARGRGARSDSVAPASELDRRCAHGFRSLGMQFVFAAPWLDEDNCAFISACSWKCCPTGVPRTWCFLKGHHPLQKQRWQMCLSKGVASRHGLFSAFGYHRHPPRRRRHQATPRAVVGHQSAEQHTIDNCGRAQLEKQQRSSVAGFLGASRCAVHGRLGRMSVSCAPDCQMSQKLRAFEVRFALMSVDWHDIPLRGEGSGEQAGHSLGPCQPDSLDCCAPWRAPHIVQRSGYSL